MVLVEGVIDDIRKDALFVRSGFTTVREVFDTVGGTAPWASRAHSRAPRMEGTAFTSHLPVSR